MATIDGTSASETLTGGSDADLINGYAGNDTLIGGGGNDTMIGGTGDDYFYISGTSVGYDIYNGGDGADVIYLTGDVVASSFQLTSANVIGTETLDMSFRDISGTGGDDLFNISGLTTVNNYHRFYLQDGNDRFTGYQGADAVDGGSGNDTLIGGSGSDTLTGSGGNDFMQGDSGDDYFYISGTDVGLDTFNGGDGADVIYLTGDVTAASFLLTSANVIGTETLDMSFRDISGTGGNDLFNISGLTTVNNYHRFYLYDGNDRFTGYQGADAVDGGAGNDTLIGGSGSDTLIGSGGDDHMLGDSGDDYFYIGGTAVGSDTYNGGLGSDTIYLTEDITTARLMLTSAYTAGTETLDFSYRDIAGTGGTDVIDISGMAFVRNYHWIYMNDGNDSFVGYQGSDFVNGGSGNDTLFGRAGNDELTGGTGDDVLSGGTGNDIFYIGGSDFGADRYVGAEGLDTIYLSADITVSRFVLNAANLIGTEALNMSYRSISGTGGNDVVDLLGIQYVTSYNWIELQDGNDYFRGYRGNDYVDTGSGNDTLVGGAGSDSLRGGTGTDTVVYQAALGGIRVNLSLTSAQTIGGGEGVDTLDSIERVIGSNFNDAITGNADANLLLGNGGNDLIEGGAGNDVLNGGTGIDTVSFSGATSGVTVNLAVGSAQNVGGGMGMDVIAAFENLTGSGFGDRLTGNSGGNIISSGLGNDIVIASGGNDTIYASTGNDTVSGGDGNDMLWGQSGNDALSGGTGADLFVFQLGGGADRINDWQNGTDRMEIRAGTAYNDFGDLTVTSVGGNAVVSFGGSSITLVGVSVGQIDASDFIFA